MPSLMNQNITYLKGVGAHRAKLFAKIGAPSIGALLRTYPRTYEEWYNIFSIADAPFDSVCCVKGVIASNVSERKIRSGMTIYKLTVHDGYDIMEVTFFNNKYVSNSLTRGEEFVFRGVIKNSNYTKEMLSPSFCAADNFLPLIPVYFQTSGLSSRQIFSAVKNALLMLPDKINDPIPLHIREQFGLCNLRYAIENIHCPTSKEALNSARTRLIFEELFILQTGLLSRKASSMHKSTMKLHTDHTHEFQQLLPFSLTHAQIKSIRECIADMRSDSFVMSRLLQGDVGSGKTAVCAALCYCAVLNGMQCAFMAPTEILAKQHYAWFCKLFAQCGFNIKLLTGSTTLAQRKKILSDLKSGDVSICIGTHALLSENVDFNKLGLVITDEQHRFGVAQRARLISKGNNPHMLVMSATPIPRTLALILNGDLDISTLDELPPGRKPIVTSLIDSSKRSQALSFIREQLDNGYQCYIICPLIEDNGMDLHNVKTYAEKLAHNELQGYSIALLHSKMKSSEKNKVMQSFLDNKTQVLVSTVVVEVGVDVPNANIILIENAERFGLSQLHQLRGRVGRGTKESHCILVSDNKNPDTIHRLNIIASTCNGFQIADEDLKIRGPGDFFGERQHGLPELKIANLVTNMSLLKQIETVTKKIITDDPNLSDDEHRTLKAEINRLFSQSENYIQ